MRFDIGWFIIVTMIPCLKLGDIQQFRTNEFQAHLYQFHGGAADTFDHFSFWHSEQSIRSAHVETSNPFQFNYSKLCEPI